MRVKAVLLTTVAGIPAFGLVEPAAAQTVTLDAPPVRQAIDENGVDLATGAVVVPSSVLTIGGDLGISHSRYRVENGWRHNWILSITRKAGSVNTEFSVQIGGSRRKFIEVSPNEFEGTDGEEGTLTKDSAGFTYTNSQGTVYRFDIAPVSNGESYYESVEAVGTKVTHPNGHETTLHYARGTYFIEAPYGGYVEIYAARLQSVTNNAGYQLKFAYDSNDLNQGSANDWYQVERVTAINNTEQYCDPVADICALDNKWPFLAYSRTTDGSRTVETVTDILNRQTRFATDGAKRLIGVKRPGESEDGMVIAYDADDRVDWIKHQNEYVRQYDWSVLGTTLTARSTDYLGRDRTVEIDSSSGIVKSETNALGHTTRYEHDADGRVTSILTPEGQRTVMEYDARGRVTRTLRYGKNGEGPITTSATYPALLSGSTICSNAVTCDKPLTTIDALGNVTRYEWGSGHGGLLRITSPPASDGRYPEQRIIYTAVQGRRLNATNSVVDAGPALMLPSTISTCRTGNRESCVDTADERKTWIGYAQSGLHNALPTNILVTATGLSSYRNDFTYDHLGNVVSVDGSLPGADDRTSFYYDAAGQTIGSVSPDPDGAGGNPRVAERRHYNLDGQVWKSETGTATGSLSTFVPDQTYITQFDDFGRAIAQQHTAPGSGPRPQYSLVEYGYDGAGRLECVAQRMNAPTTATPPSDPCQQTDASDRITQNVYDIADRTIETWTGRGTPLAQRTAQFEYDDNGQMHLVRDARGSSTGYDLDEYGRVQRIRYPDPSTGNAAGSSDYEEVSYDQAGNILSHRTRRGEVISYTYDNLNRLISKVVPQRASQLDGSHTRDVAYRYDLFGNLTSVKFTDGDEGYVFGYDTLGRPTTVTSTMGGIARNLVYQHDAAGRRTGMIHADGVPVTYTYDGLDRLKEMHVNYDRVLSNAFHTQGQIGSIWHAPGAYQTQFGNDGALRVREININKNGSAYDNRQILDHNAASQVVNEQITNQQYAWNAHPDFTRDTSYQANALNQYTQAGTNGYTYDANGNLQTDGTFYYSYDSENRLVAISSGVQMHYDPLGRLWQVTDAHGNKRRMLYDGSDLVAEYDPSGNMIRRYVHGVDGGDDPYIVYSGSNASLGNAQFLYKDRLGSIVLQADATGSSAEAYAYDEFGVPGTNRPEHFGFTGQLWLPEAGLYYYKARMYSPTLGRFMQTDPIGYGDGLNMYRYVQNDPVNGVDPTGLFGLKDCSFENNGYWYRPRIGDGTAENPYTWGEPRYVSHGVTVNCQTNFGSASAGLGENRSGGRGYSQPGTRPQSDGSVLESRKGERGRAGSRHGTRNPDKHMKPVPGRPGYGQVKDPQTGKLSGPKPWPTDPRLGPQTSDYTPLIVVGAAIIIIGGIILAPEITIPALIFGGGSTALAN